MLCFFAAISVHKHIQGLETAVIGRKLLSEWPTFVYASRIH